MKIRKWYYENTITQIIIICLYILIVPYLYSATYTVTNTLDIGPGSLIDAITATNISTNVADTINFFIPSTGPYIIRPLSQLPQLTDPAGVFINGLTQPGALTGSNPPATANLLIELRGTNAGASHGLWIMSPNNKIQGLVIDSFQQDGIRIQGTPSGTSNNIIYCNFVGVDRLGNLIMRNG